VSAQLSEGGRIARNFAALSGGQAAASVAGLVSTAFVARMLGTEAFGVLGFGVALLSYFGLAVTMGTDVYAARQIAQDRDAAPGLLRDMLGLRCVAAAATAAIYVAVVAALPVAETTRNVLWIQGVGLVAAAFTLDFVFQGFQRMGTIAVRQTAASFLSLAIVLSTVRAPGDIYLAAAAPVAAGVIAAFWMAGRLHRRVMPIAIAFRPEAWGRMLRASAPIGIAQLMAAVFYYVDIVMLGFMATPHETGVYVSMSRILMIALVASGLINAVFMPVVAGAWPDIGPMRGRYRDLAIAALLAGGPVACIGMAFPKEIIAVLFGADYVSGATALVILMGMAMTAFLTMAPGGALVSWHEQNWHMIAYTAGAAANAALNLVLIPRYGIEGAAVATLLAQIVVFAVLTGRVRVRFGMIGLGPAVVLAIAAAAAAFAGRLAADAVLDGALPLFVLATGSVVAGLVFVALAAVTGIVPLRRLRGAVTGRPSP
jgi:O-antigen/teichoic acid export membrane protein